MLHDMTVPVEAEILGEDMLASWAAPLTVEPEIDEISSLSDAVRLCLRVSGLLHADAFSLFFVVSQGDTARLAPVFDTSFPGISSLSRALSSRDTELFALSACKVDQPIWWGGRERHDVLSASALAWAVEVENPIEQAGIAFPVAQERGRAGLVVFTGSAMNVDETNLCEAHSRCFTLFAHVAKQRVQDCAKKPNVSKREIECLRLTADGLTSDDIATSLGLSVHTANQYLTNSTQKLNAVNRIHAVAKAMRSGLID